LKAILKQGVLCVQCNSDTIILDTGSPVSLGTGSVLDLDGISIQTHRSILGHTWQSVEETIPFSATALVGTDQIGDRSICIDIQKQYATWGELLNSGSPLEMISGVPVIPAMLNGKSGHFFFDTGASICYVANESFLDGCEFVDHYEDFHPILGKFTTKLFSASLNMNENIANVDTGILPNALLSMMNALGIDGIIGTNSILSGEIQLDLTNHLYVFADADNGVPHDSWAHCYDELFEASFGSMLSHITGLTVELVSGLSEPSESILDVGAGTGRISGPLLQRGFYVSALDPSAGMLNHLRNRFPDHSNLELLHQPIAHLKANERFNGALCVFTVSSYWLDEATLRDSLSAIYNALLPGGWLIIDRTLRDAFASTQFQTEKIQRQATVETLGDDIYRFTEKSKVISSSNNIAEANESFLIRFWQEDIFLDHALSIGFKLEQDLSHDFAGSGASFYLLRKI